MRVHKSGHDYTPAGVDDFAIADNQTLNLSPPSDRFDLLAAHEHRSIFNDCQLTQITADARAPGTGERYQL